MLVNWSPFSGKIDAVRSFGVEPILLLDFLVTYISSADVPVSVHQFLEVLPIEAGGIYYSLLEVSVCFLERRGFCWRGLYPVWGLWRGLYSRPFSQPWCGVSVEAGVWCGLV